MVYTHTPHLLFLIQSNQFSSMNTSRFFSATHFSLTFYWLNVEFREQKEKTQAATILSFGNPLVAKDCITKLLLSRKQATNFPLEFVSLFLRISKPQFNEFMGTFYSANQCQYSTAIAFFRSLYLT